MTWVLREESEGAVPTTDRYPMLGSEHSHSLDVFIWDVGGDDQDGGIGVTQLVGAVHLTDGPALVRETLAKKDRTNTEHFWGAGWRCLNPILNNNISAFICVFKVQLYINSRCEINYVKETIDHLPDACTLLLGHTPSSHLQETAPCTGRQRGAARWRGQCQCYYTLCNVWPSLVTVASESWNPLYETDQAVRERKGVFDHSLQYIWKALLRLIGKPGTPHVLMQGEESKSCNNLIRANV